LRIFISGAAGFIGAELCGFALRSGYEIVFFDNVIPSDIAYHEILNHKKCTVIKGNLSDLTGISGIIKTCKTVIHLAGVSDAIQGNRNPVKTKHINIDCTKTFINLCQNVGVKLFLFASTMGVYGNSYTETLHEKLNLKPSDPYSKSKMEIEQFLKLKSDPEFCACSLRIAMVYGKSISNRSDLLVNKLIKLAKETGKINIYGGKQKRPQIHVTDVAKIITQLIDINPSLLSGESYNLVESNPNIEEIASLIKIYIPNLELNFLEQRENENSFVLSGDKIHGELGITPNITLIKGIEQTILNLNS
jgi:nucleoside-diphosphate-sugar epimerase